MLQIRREKFGGIVFNTENGSQLTLDQEGFNVFYEHVSKKDSGSGTQFDFLSNVVEKLELRDKEIFNYVSVDRNQDVSYPFEVLSAPILLDLQLTTTCNLACPHCYVNSSKNGFDAPFEDVVMVLDQAKEIGVFEIAFGGGEVTLYPEFEQILKETYKRNLVPNFASNGVNFTNSQIKAMKKYVGAVALSIEHLGQKFEKRRGFSFGQFISSIELLKKKDINLVFQVTVSEGNLCELSEVCDFLLHYEPYGIVFLTYKPVGRAICYDVPLKKVSSQKVVNELKSVFTKLQDRTKVGYDCCLANALVNSGICLNEDIQGCSALRSSIAVNYNMDVVPCSFSSSVLGNLKSSNLYKIWSNEHSHLFRKKFIEETEQDGSCKSCNVRWNCLGGCPEFDLVECSV